MDRRADVVNGTPAAERITRRVSWKPFAVLVAATAAALALRIASGPDVSYSTDMSHFVGWADAAASHPLGEAYARTSPNYPPAYVSVLWGLGKARSAFPILKRRDVRYL